MAVFRETNFQHIGICWSISVITCPDKTFENIVVGKKIWLPTFTTVPAWFPTLLQVFTTHSEVLTTLKWRSFENTAGKGENTGHQHILLFPWGVLPYLRQITNK